ncbi:MAG: RidA family protein [Phycisphaerales bacterium]|nr:RidA family protein [Phycisphaerales bacterium]
MSIVESRLLELGIDLPEPPGAAANYVPVRLAGDLAFVAGQIPQVRGELSACGPVPTAQTPEQAQEAARVCAINALSALKAALGDLDRITDIIRVGVFVASDPSFTGQPIVANGASDVLVAVFGERGQHARAAVGSVALPLGATVEVEMVVQFK